MARSRNGYRKRVTNCASSLDDVKVLNDSKVPSILVFSFILQRRFGTPSEKFRNIWCRLILAVDSYLPRLRRLGVSGSLSISTGKTIVRTLSIEWKFHSTLPLSLTRCSSTTRIYLCDTNFDYVSSLPPYFQIYLPSSSRKEGAFL